jgi:hypothetical protein
MAQLNTRGTFVRDRLDFYEQSNCWGFVYGSVNGGGISAYLINNGAGNLQLDIYGIQWFSSTPEPWDVAVHHPVQLITPVTPIDAQIHCIQPDLPMPVGVVGMASAFTPDIYHIVLHQSGGATSGTLDIGYASPHIVLPPGWLFSVSSTVTGLCELSMTVFYQMVLDNIPPVQ